MSTITTEDLIKFYDYQKMLKSTKQPETRYKILKMALYEQLKQLTEEEQRLILEKT